MEQHSTSQEETLPDLADSSDLDEEEISGDVVEDFARQVEALNIQESRWKDYTTLDDEGFDDANGKEEEADEEVSDAASWGYQALTQDEDGFEEEGENGHDDNHGSNVEDIDELSETLAESEELSNVPTLRSVFKVALDPSEKIPDGDLAVINSVMSKLKLPDIAIPGWARSIPESAWLPRVNDEEEEYTNKKP